MTKSIHLVIRAGERFFVNGAVIRFNQKTTIELLNTAVFLLEHHVLHADQTTTPLRQLYFALQAMVIDPTNRAAAAELFAALHLSLLKAVSTPSMRHGLLEVGRLVDEGRLIDALKAIRALYPAEAAILDGTHDPKPRAALPRTATPSRTFPDDDRIEPVRDRQPVVKLQNVRQ